MSHPFQILFERALKKSFEDENLVLKEAKKLRERGYSEAEIIMVLNKLLASLIQDDDIAIVENALDDFVGEENHDVS